MKQLIFTLAALIPSIFLNAQNIGNADFESWKSSGKEPPFNWEEPTGWKTTNSLTEWTSAGVSKSTSKQEGSFSAKIKSVMINGGWYSVLCNGNPKLISDFTAPDIDIITGGEVFDPFVNPAGLSGYYKFTANTAGDSGYVVVLLKKYNAQTKSYEIHAEGKRALPPASAFTYFEVPINYNQNADPDSFVIAFYSTLPHDPVKPENFTGLGELYVDNIQFTTTLGNKQPAQNHSEIIIYPNPANDFIMISFENKEPSNGQVNIYSMEGKRVFSGDIITKTTVNTKHFEPGLYMVEVKNSSGITKMQKLIIQ